MKKGIVFVVLCLVIPALLFTQTTSTQKASEAEGTKLGTIISTVIGIVLPQVQPLIKLIFPEQSKDTDKATISKQELQKKLDGIKAEMEKQIKNQLDPVARIAKEVQVLGNVLKPCIEVQDYLREINVLIAKSNIPDDNWKRVKTIWPSMEKMIKSICSDKDCDLKSIRNSYVKDDLTRIVDVANGSKLDRIKMDYIDLQLDEINTGDKATLLRVAINDLLELYQTVQRILTLSLQDFQADFAGTYEALSLKKSVETMSTEEESNPIQEDIVARLDDVLERLKDKE
jgi:hypothetical protein